MSQAATLLPGQYKFSQSPTDRESAPPTRLQPGPGPEGLRVYIAGPMSGIDGFNYERFAQVSEELKALGYIPVDPGELAEPEAAAQQDPHGEHFAWWRYCLERDIALVSSPAVEAIIVIPGWQHSDGALLECQVAASLKKPIYTYPDWQPVEFPALRGDKTDLAENAAATHATTWVPARLHG